MAHSFSFKATDPGRVAPDQRKAFFEEANRQYLEEKKQREAENLANEKKRSFLDDLEKSTSKARLRKREREAARTQAYNTMLNSLKNREDLGELAEKGAAKADRKIGGYLGNRVQSEVNKANAMDEWKRANGMEEYVGQGYKDNAYSYMTPEQLNIYNAFIGLGDRASARRYLQSIEGEINQKAAEEAAKNAKNYGLADVAIMGADSGAQGFMTEMRSIGKPNGVAPSYQEMLFGEVRPTLNEKAGKVADISQAVGQQILPVAGSALLSAGGVPIKAARAVGAALMGTAAGAGAYNNALRDAGTDKFDAKVYGIVNGALEGGLQYALGGIGALGKGGLSKVIGKAGLKKLANVSKAAAATPAVKNLVKTLVAAGQYAGGSVDEFVEEWMQAVLDVVVRNYIFDENNEIKPFDEEKLYQGLIGGFTAGIFNLPSVPSNFVNADQTLQNALAEKPRKGRRGSDEYTSRVSAPEVTDAEVAPFMGNQDVADLVAQVNTLEAAIAKDKGKHPGYQKNLDKAKTTLAELVQKLQADQEQQAAPAEANLPTPPTPPAGNEPTSSASGLDLINAALGEDVENMDNYTRTRQGEPGRNLIQAGMRNGTEGIIAPPVPPTPVQGERQTPVSRGRNLRPGEVRRQNMQERRGQMQQNAQEQQQIAQLEAQSQQLQEEIKQQNELLAQLTGETASETEAPAEATAPAAEQEEEGYTAEELVERFRADMEEADTLYRGNMTKADYNRYIDNLATLFESDAKAAGMSDAEIEAIINGEGSTTNAVSREEKVAPTPAKTAPETVTDQDINEALGEEPAPAEKPAAETKPEIRDIVEAASNEEMTTNEAVDEIEALLNQRDAEREAAGEVVGEAGEKPQLGELSNEPASTPTEPEVNVTEGRIEVKFPKWPGKDVTKQLKDAGFSWDKNTKIWWGGENSTNRALIEELTGVKLAEDEFKPEVRRIPKEELNNATEGQRGGLDNSRGTGRDVVLADQRTVGILSDATSTEDERLHEKQRNDYYALRIERKARRDQISRLNLPVVDGKTIHKGLPKSMVNISMADLEKFDLSAPEWRGLALTLEDLKGDNFSKDHTVHFFMDNDADGNCAGITFPKSKEVWINLGCRRSVYQAFQHEKFHVLVGQHGYALMTFVRGKLADAGLSNERFNALLVGLAENIWKDENSDNARYRYGALKDKSSYMQYAEELFAQFYSRAAWLHDFSQPPSEYKNYFEDENRYKAHMWLLGLSQEKWEAENERVQGIINKEELDKLINTVEDAVAEYANLDRSTRLKQLSNYSKRNFWSLDENINTKGNTESTLNDDEGAFLKENPVPSSTFTHNKSGEVPVENMIPGVKEIWEGLPDSVKRHITKHLTDINGEAWKNIMKKGGVDAVSGTLLRAKNWTSPQLEMAVEVGKYFADNGETDRAADIFAKVASQQTDFGRAIKYLHTLQMYMPKSAAAVTHSIANDLGVELTAEEQANIDLCDRIIEQGFISDSVMKAATGDFKDWLNDARDYVNRGQMDATTAAYAAAMTVVTAKKPATARQKFRSLQRISLLSNPKTHFRNILGNMAEQAGAAMSRPVADLTDRFLSKFTKGQRTFGAGGGEAFAKSFTDSVERAVMDHALGINTVGNKFDEDATGRKGLERLVQQNAWDEHTQSEVRNGIARVANNIDNLIGLGLSIGDAPFLIGTYESALAQIMNANNETEPTAEMIDTAWDVAYRRTFRDDNSVTKALSSIRNSLPFVGETIAPYVQTPVNVVLTAIQYSPIGFGEAFAKALVGKNSMRVKLQNNESTMKVQRQIAELVGRGALGTACMLAGALLASAGRITGDDDDIDSTKERNWNRAVGRTGSSIKVGDTYIDPSSLQSLSTPIMAGAAAWEGGEGDGTDWAGILGAGVKASMKMGNTMLEMPVLQGVADLFSGNYDNGEILAGALSLAGNAATQVVPFGSLLKQGAKAVDPYSRVQSEINVGPGERVVKSTVNNLRSMTPWGRQKLSERYDVLGNPITNDASDSTLGRIYNSFLNPFNTSKDKSNEVTEEIDRLYESLKDTAVLPSAAGNSVSYGGEQYKFSSADKQEYQRVEGESNSAILSSLVNSDAYNNLSDEDRAKVLDSVYRYSANKAKAEYLKKQGVSYESDAKWMDSIDKIVETGVDIGDAMVWRYELSDIKGSDNQVFYIDKLPLNATQKDAFDEAFVDRYRSSYIDEDRDYTTADTLALSMTSDSGREKYDNRFSHSWTGSSGNTYGAMTGEQFGHFYDAYQSGSNSSEKVAAIKQMLMSMYHLDEDDAYTMAYDFRKYYAAKYD